MEVLFIFLFGVYIFLIIGLIIGWRKATSKVVIQQSDSERLISIIVPVRNECFLLPLLINDLKQQSYRTFEVLIVDDHSNDNTFEIAIKCNDEDKRFTILSATGQGKKQALTQGIAKANGAIIVTTDADCRVQQDWLQEINKCFNDHHTKMVFGAVQILEDETLFSKLQALEFSSLIATGAATQALGFPTMCNAANFAFRKTIFEEVGGYSDNLHIASGDDEFLMRKVFDKYPGGIMFMQEAKSLVSTYPQKKLKDFIQQRMRWAGKWKHNHNITNKILAVYIFVFQLSVLASLPVTLFKWIKPQLFILLISAKALSELLFLLPVTKYLKLKWRWSSFLSLQILYPCYAVYIGIVTHFQQVNWKGRSLK